MRRLHTFFVIACVSAFIGLASFWTGRLTAFEPDYEEFILSLAYQEAGVRAAAVGGPDGGTLMLVFATGSSERFRVVHWFSNGSRGTWDCDDFFSSKWATCIF